MPGFGMKLQDREGSISETLFTFDKQTCYPVRMKEVGYSIDSPEEKIFIDQRYYDLDFNLNIEDTVCFNTSTASLMGFEIIDMQPF